MTNYQRGFLIKCAEYGINPYFAGRVLKLAQAASATSSAASPAVGEKPPKSIAGHNVFEGMSDARKQAFRDWAKRDGNGQAFGAMFRDANGNIDTKRYNQFFIDHQDFLTGSDTDRARIANEYRKTLNPEQQATWKNNPIVQARVKQRQQQIRQEQQHAANSIAPAVKENLAIRRAYNSAWSTTPSQFDQATGYTAVPQKQHQPGYETTRIPTTGLQDGDLSWWDKGENLNADEYTRRYDRNIPDTVDSFHRYQDWRTSPEYMEAYYGRGSGWIDPWEGQGWGGKPIETWDSWNEGLPKDWDKNIKPLPRRRR